MELNHIISKLINNTSCYIKTSSEDEFKKFKQKGKHYLYLIIWDFRDGVFSWGTMSGNSDRIRKSSILNKKLTGKYDRRVDYLMLKKITGLEYIYLFETKEKSTIIESEIKHLLGVKSCFYGLEGGNRDEISRNLYNRFKLTDHFLNQSKTDKKNFDVYFNDVFLGKKKHPDNPKRTFYYGDSLEPGFLRKINCDYMEVSIEKMLDVIF